jgi:hypothetical protein
MSVTQTSITDEDNSNSDIPHIFFKFPNHGEEAETQKRRRGGGGVEELELLLSKCWLALEEE